MIEPTVIRLRHNFADGAAVFAAAPDIAAEELGAGIAEASLLLEREVRERTPTSGAGTLRDSIGALPVTFAGPVVSGGVGTALAYAQPVETGSRPHMPPVEPLADWVARKLGKRGPEGRGIAWAIARKIARDGTEGVHMFAEGLAATETQIRAILERTYAAILTRTGRGAP